MRKWNGDLPRLHYENNVCRVSVCVSVRLSVCLSVCLFVCLSFCLYVCLSVCLSACMHVCICKKRELPGPGSTKFCSPPCIPNKTCHTNLVLQWNLLGWPYSAKVCRRIFVVTVEYLWFVTADCVESFPAKRALCEKKQIKGRVTHASYINASTESLVLYLVSECDNRPKQCVLFSW